MESSTNTCSFTSNQPDSKECCYTHG